MDLLPAQADLAYGYPTPTSATRTAAYVALRKVLEQMGQAAELDIASAATTDIGAALSNRLRVTGTVGITSLGANYRGIVLLRFAAACAITHNATSLICPGGQSFSTVAGDVMLAYPKATAAVADGWMLVPVPATRIMPEISVPMRGYLDGLNQSSPGTSANHTVTAGVATDSTNAFMMRLASSLTKTTSNWGVGPAAGGKFRAAAIAASASYWWYLVRRPDTGVVDVGFSTSATGLVAADFVSGGGNLPDVYTQWRSLHGWKTDGSSQWVAGNSDGDMVYLGAYVTDYNNNTHGGATVTTTLSIPAGRAIRPMLSAMQWGSSAQSFQIWNPASSGALAGETVQMVSPNDAGGNGWGAINTERVRSNASGQVSWASGAAGTNVLIRTCGWVDTRGRNA